MSEAATRRGTREKKPSRQYWYGEEDYNSLPSAKNYEQKERFNSAQDINQIAKLLCRFMHSSNNRYRELIDTQGLDINQNLQDPPKDTDIILASNSRRTDPRFSRDQSTDNRNNRQREQLENANGEGKAISREGKIRGSKAPRSNQQIAATLETDLSYHNALNEHVKNAYPNINALSPDMLRELSIPTEILNRQQTSKQKPKEEKRQPSLKPLKDQNKPFKRQSYHVAIAYHIHLKQVKSTKSVQYVDPTYPARKLREQTNAQTKKP